MNEEQTVYSLGLVRPVDPDKEVKSPFYMPVELSKDEFERCTKAVNELRRFNSSTELFRICLWNYQDYYYTLDACFEEWISRTTAVDGEELRLNINRQFLNILSSIKTYIDHTSHGISSRYGGKSSEEFKNFEKYQSQEFGSNLAYKILYTLRNYAQHRDLPLNRVGFSVEKNEANPKETIFTFSLGFYRDELLADAKINSLVRAELEKLPEYVEINPYLNSYMSSIDRIAAKAADDELPILLPGASYLFQMLQKIPAKDGKPAIFIINIKKTADGKLNPTIGVVEIPWELVCAIVENKLPQYTKRTQVLTLAHPMVRRRTTDQG